MPIADDIKQFYPDDWDEIRAAVLGRAASREKTEAGYLMPQAGIERIGKPCCEWCGKPNGVEVPVHGDGRWQWMTKTPEGDVSIWLKSREGKDLDGFMLDYEPEPHWQSYDRLTKTVLTVAHLDQDPRGSDIERLRALCQRCHIAYDKQPAQRAKRERIYAELRGQGVLFGGAV